MIISDDLSSLNLNLTYDINPVDPENSYLVTGEIVSGQPIFVGFNINLLTIYYGRLNSEITSINDIVLVNEGETLNIPYNQSDHELSPHPLGCYGENIAPRNVEGDKSTYSPWKVLRDDWEQTISQFAEINSLAFIHDKDPYENSETLSFLNKINKFQIVNYTDFGCNKMAGTSFHSAIVYPREDNCFTKWEAKHNYIINYLEEIF